MVNDNHIQIILEWYFLVNVNSLYVVVRPSVCLSVCNVPGAATNGVTPIFPEKNDDLFNDFTRLSPPRKVSPRTFLPIRPRLPLFFVNSITFFFHSGVTPWRVPPAPPPAPVVTPRKPISITTQLCYTYTEFVAFGPGAGEPYHQLGGDSSLKQWLVDGAGREQVPVLCSHVTGRFVHQLLDRCLDLIEVDAATSSWRNGRRALSSTTPGRVCVNSNNDRHIDNRKEVVKQANDNTQN